MKNNPTEEKPLLEAEEVAAQSAKAEGEIITAETAESEVAVSAEKHKLTKREQIEKRIEELKVVPAEDAEILEKNKACIAENNFEGFDDAAEGRKQDREHELRALQDGLVEADKDHLLEVRHLKMYFPIKKSMTGKVTQWLRAVDDV